MADNDSLDATSAITLELWVKFSDFDASYNLVLKKVGWNGIGYGLYRNTNGSLYFEAANASDYLQVSSGIVLPNSDLGDWVHIAVVCDQTATTYLKFYRNSNLMITESPSTLIGDIGTNTLPLLLGSGSGGSNTGASFTGILDEPRIYNRALTSKEITNNYKFGLRTHS